MVSSNNFQLIYKTERNILFYLLGFGLILIGFLVGAKAVSLFITNEYLYGLRYVIAVFFFLFCSVALMHKKVILTNAFSKEVLLRYEIFGIRFVKEERFQFIDYVAVIGNKRNVDYTIKLQFLNGKGQPIIFRTDREETLELVKLLVKRLEVKLLDATDMGGGNWINIV